jgi:hypothetical protein
MSQRRPPEAIDWLYSTHNVRKEDISARQRRLPVSAAAGADGHQRMKPLVSVIIPTHNRASLLREALASVESQQGIGRAYDLEIIVVDDASSDETPQIARAHAGVRYLRLPINRGLPAARNAGVQASRGRYLAFLDDDDLWFPCKLECQVAALESHPEAGVVYSPCIVRSDHREFLVPAPGQAPAGQVLESLLEHNLAPVHCFLVRRALLDAAGHFDERLPCFEDHDLWLRLAIHTPFLFVPRPVGIYRLSPMGMNRAQHATGGAEDASRHILEKMVALLPNSGAARDARSEAQACLEFHIACHLIFNRDVDAARPHLRAAVDRFLGARKDAYRASGFPRIAGLFAAAAASPIPMTRVLCAEIRRAAGSLGPGRPRVLANLLADLWGQVANDLGFVSRGRDRDAGYAAVTALLHGPSALRHRKSLLWLIARGIAGRRFDPVLATLQRRMHRLA